MSVWDRIADLADADTRGLAERSMLLAAIRWVDADGLLWPTLATWAHTAGLSRRGAQRAIQRLVDRGILEVVQQSRGGRRVASVYRLTLTSAPPPAAVTAHPVRSNGALTAPPVRSKGGQTAHPVRGLGAETAHGAPAKLRTARPLTAHGAPALRRTTKEQPEEEQPQQGDVVVDSFSRWGIESLRGDPNATPERIAWIDREAATKANPSAWAAACIRQGWAVPPPTPADADDHERRRAQREQRVEAWRALAEPERLAVLAKAERARPEHVSDWRMLRARPDYPHADPMVVHAIAKAMAGREGGGR